MRYKILNLGIGVDRDVRCSTIELRNVWLWLPDARVSLGYPLLFCL